VTFIRQAPRALVSRGSPFIGRGGPVDPPRPFPEEAKLWPEESPSSRASIRDDTC